MSVRSIIRHSQPTAFVLTIAAVLAALVVGCNERHALVDSRGFSHERLRRAAAVRVRLAGDDLPEEREMSASALAARYGDVEQCPPVAAAVSLPCTVAIVTAQTALCRSNMLVNAAVASRADIVFTWTPNGEAFFPVTVPSQEPAAQAELLTESLRQAEGAMLYAGYGAEIAVCDASDRLVLANGEPVPVVLENYVLEANSLVLEIRRRLLDVSSAIGESNNALAADRAEAAHDSTAPFASPVHAAHVLVGGTEGLPVFFPPPDGGYNVTLDAGVADGGGVDGGLPFVSDPTESSLTPEGLFPNAPLTAGQRRALDVLRIAGPSPALITGAAMDDFLTTSAGSPTYSIVQRYAAAQGEPDLYTADLSGFLDALGLTLEDFRTARAYMAREIRFFARSRTATVGSTTYRYLQPSPDGGVGTQQSVTFTRYVATALPPTAPPDIYWSAAVRFDATPTSLPHDYIPSLTTNSDGEKIAGGTSEGLLATLAGVFRHPGALYGREGAWNWSGAETYGVRAPGGELAAVALGALAERTLGRLAASSSYVKPQSSNAARAVQACFSPSASAGVYRAVFDLQRREDDSGAEFVFVLGREGLECAMYGRYEGVPCSATTFSTTSADYLLTSDELTHEEGDGATRRFLVTDLSVIDEPSTGTTPVFVLRTLAANDEPMPGGYEPVAGFMYRPTPGRPLDNVLDQCFVSFFEESYEHEVAALIAPSLTDHARTAETCAGISRDQRIPLENELTEDNNGVESSWRHYLTLAREAAARADMLGEQVVEAGLQMDMRAEASIDEINRFCGTHISVTSLGDLPTASEAPDGSGNCPDTHRLAGGRCVFDLWRWLDTESDSSNLDVRALASCLSSQASSELVALGDRDLCTWDYVDGDEVSVPGSFCLNAADPARCVVAAQDGSTDAARCAAILPLPAASSGNTARLRVVTDRLNIFTTPEAYPPEVPSTLGDLPCDALATLREGWNQEAWDELQSSGFLSVTNIRPLAENLSATAHAGDEVDLRYGTVRLGSTASGSGIWPLMGSHPRCSGTDGLFCLGATSAATGSSRVARARVNDRLLRAALAIKALTGGTTASLVVPFYPAQRSDVRPINGAVLEEPGWLQVAPLGSVSRFMSQNSGSLMVDAILGDPTEEVAYQREELGLRFQELLDGTAVTGSCDGGANVSAGAEWIHAPYDRTDMRVFDDADDCDDDSIDIPFLDDSDLPFLAQSLGELEADDAAVQAARLWAPNRGRIPAWLRSRLESRDELDASIQQLDSGATPFFTARLGLASLSRVFDPIGLSTGSGGHFGEVCRERAHMAVCNAAHLGTSVSLNELLDGMQMVCEGELNLRSNSESASVVTCADAASMPMNSVRDANRAEVRLNCLANDVRRRFAASAIAGLDTRTVDALRSGGGGLYGGDSGDLAAQLSDIRSALYSVRTQGDAMATRLQSFAGAVRAVRNAVEASGYAREIADLELAKDMFKNAADCAKSVTEANWSNPGSYGGIAVACTNAVIQSNLTARVTAARRGTITAEEQSTYARFDQEVASASGDLNAAANEIAASMARVNAALARLNAMRSSARNALARALYLDSESTRQHIPVNDALHARYNTALARYEEAHRTAVRTAFIARLALEQRLGMPLGDMEDPLITVDPPSEWADRVCNIPSIDYRRISGATGDAIPSYADMYVGDYVNRLEQVFESYSFAFPFQAGTDTAVVSLRDDVNQVRSMCAAPSVNLLRSSSALDEADMTETRPWAVRGCTNENVTADAGVVVRHCASAVRSATAPTLDLHSPRSTPAVYIGRVGGSAAASSSIEDPTRLSQDVALRPGRYRLSWIANDGAMGLGREETVVGVAGAVSASSEVTCSALPTAGWYRCFKLFAIDQNETVEVRVLDANAMSASSITSTVTEVQFAAIMLEDVSGIVTGELPSGEPNVVLGPFAYFETDAAGNSVQRMCPDTNGVFFRAEHWQEGCERVCPAGTGAACGNAATRRCYWQTSLTIDSERMARMFTRRSTGFAAGNYNYRVDSVGLNFVGVGLRACGDEQGCYGAGNLAYTLLHDGPFTLRNARGQLYDAPLFPGRIESARALAAERYLTNPISSADQALIQPYMRNEFQGRPLGGTLTLRIWKDPGVVFENLEDVQIVLNYRYWTHQR